MMMVEQGIRNWPSVLIWSPAVPDLDLSPSHSFYLSLSHSLSVFLFLSSSPCPALSYFGRCRAVPAASLPVTQQMTEMSISREEKVTTPKSEVAEPGTLSFFFFAHIHTTHHTFRNNSLGLVFSRHLLTCRQDRFLCSIND